MRKTLLFVKKFFICVGCAMLPCGFFIETENMFWLPPLVSLIGLLLVMGNLFTIFEDKEEQEPIIEQVEIDDSWSETLKYTNWSNEL